jgi:disulfide bond formation protein DsbB
MVNRDENTQEFLFVPIISALILIFGVAVLIWTTQVRPAIQTARADKSSPVSSALAEISKQAETNAETEAVTAHPILGDPTLGEQLFAGTCAACHGPTGEGISGLGKDLTASEFVIGKADQELLDFVKVGRDPSDPLNTTGIGMPPKGGNPALDDEDLQNIISYLRTIQK